MGGSVGAIEGVYYSKGNKPAEKNVIGATDDLVKQVSALVVVMESAPEAPVTATPSTNSKNTSLKRQRILRE